MVCTLTGTFARCHGNRDSKAIPATRRSGGLIDDGQGNLCHLNIPAKRAVQTNSWVLLLAKLSIQLGCSWKWGRKGQRKGSYVISHHRERAPVQEDRGARKMTQHCVVAGEEGSQIMLWVRRRPSETPMLFVTGIRVLPLLVTWQSRLLTVYLSTWLRSWLCPPLTNEGEAVHAVPLWGHLKGSGVEVSHRDGPRTH